VCWQLLWTLGWLPCVCWTLWTTQCGLPWGLATPLASRLSKGWGTSRSVCLGCSHPPCVMPADSVGADCFFSMGSAIIQGRNMSAMVASGAAFTHSCLADLQCCENSCKLQAHAQMPVCADALLGHMFITTTQSCDWP